MGNRRFVIIITGPTGVGKSDFAEKLATDLSAEIINADMGQLYMPLTIGTAKPDWRHSPIKHHLFDILDKPLSYSVAQYRQALLDIVQQVWQRNHIPIIVGGSSYYINALFFPPLAAVEQGKGANSSFVVSWESLNAIDPVRAQQIHPHDTYRIERALAIWHTTQQKPSVYQPYYQPFAPYFMFFVTRDRSQLYERINQRTHEMIKHGWIEEVQSLMGTEWQDFLQRKKIIGYDDIINYCLHQDTNLDDLIKIIAQKTRNYAKRQVTFWRMFEKKLSQAAQKDTETFSEIATLDLTLLDLDLYLKQLLKKLEAFI